MIKGEKNENHSFAHTLTQSTQIITLFRFDIIGIRVDDEDNIIIKSAARKCWIAESLDLFITWADIYSYRHAQAQEHAHATTKIRLIKLMNEQWTMKRFAYSLFDILLVMLGISAAFFWFCRFGFRFASDCNSRHPFMFCIRFNQDK